MKFILVILLVSFAPHGIICGGNTYACTEIDNFTPGVVDNAISSVLEYTNNALALLQTYEEQINSLYDSVLINATNHIVQEFGQSVFQAFVDALMELGELAGVPGEELGTAVSVNADVTGTLAECVFDEAKSIFDYINTQKDNITLKVKSVLRYIA